MQRGEIFYTKGLLVPVVISQSKGRQSEDMKRNLSLLLVLVMLLAVGGNMALAQTGQEVTVTV